MISNVLCANPATVTNQLTAAVTIVTPSVTISANPAGAVCAGTQVAYTATPTNGGTSPIYQWRINGTTAGTNSASYSYTPTNGDIVSCTITSNAMCANPVTASDQSTMIVNQLPTIISGTGNSICGGGTASISASVSAGSTVDWYNTATGGTLLASGTIYSVSSAGTYYAQARNTSTGCVSSSRLPVIVTTAPAPGIASTGSLSLPINTTGSATLTATPMIPPVSRIVLR
jgi:hypothetical protein